MEDEEVGLKTYGELKQIVSLIKTKQKGLKVGGVALDVLSDLVPGAQTARSTFDFVKAAFGKPDTKKTQTWIDKLDVDDEFSAIVDDTIENGFLEVIAKVIEDKPDDEPLADDFDMNIELQAYLKDKYSNAKGGIKAANENKLRKYIREEIDNMTNQGAPEDETSKSITQLGNKFLQLSKDLKRGTYKGLDTGEIKSLDLLLANLIKAMQDGSATTLLQRLDKMIK
jgi:hypothetical protein